MEWIEVNFRLPEEHEPVLVRFMDGEVVVAYRVGRGWVPDTRMLEASNYDGGACISFNEPDDCIRHWMPLPKEPT
jgi:hypothetical protein